MTNSLNLTGMQKNNRQGRGYRAAILKSTFTPSVSVRNCSFRSRVCAHYCLSLFLLLLLVLRLYSKTWHAKLSFISNSRSKNQKTCFPWSTNENRTGVKGSTFSKRLVAINVRKLYYSSHDRRAACFSNLRASAYAM